MIKGLAYWQRPRCYQDMANTKVSRKEQVVGNEGKRAGETGLWLIIYIWSATLGLDPDLAHALKDKQLSS